MRNTSKKIISAFLTLAMMLGLFWAMPMTASAAESVEWTLQPHKQTAMEGEPVTFTVKGIASWIATPLGTDQSNNLIYADNGYWQVKRYDSNTWAYVEIDGSHVRSTTLTFIAPRKWNRAQFRYVVLRYKGIKWNYDIDYDYYYSDSESLTVNYPPAQIAQQPLNASIKYGETAKFTVTASSPYGALSYQWYENGIPITNGGKYSGATTKTLTIISTDHMMSGFHYYCELKYSWTDIAGSKGTNTSQSSSATLTVSAPTPPTNSTATPPTITTQPVDRSITAGQNTTFDIVVSGGGLQWQYRYPTGNNYSDWANIPSGSIYSTTIEQAGRLFLTNVPASYNNYQYRCVVTNSAGTATSKTVTLTVYEIADIPIIILPPILIESPEIDGPTEMTLASGYAATSTGVYTITGIPNPEVTKTSGNSKITWNNNTKKLDIATGLAAGTYPVTLTATNDIGSSSLTFTLTVTAAPTTEPATEPLTEPATEPPTESATSPTENPTEPTNPPPPPLPFPFVDVLSTDWFYNNVKTAWEMGLVNGKTPTTYEPTANLTYAEAVKLAACMHQYYQEGNVTLVIGTTNWYDTYVAYAKNNHIISKDYDWNTYATRAGYMEIFANALPDDALWAQNNVANGSIPDVPMSHPQAAAIYKLYRAGIVQGVDNVTHACNPGSNIQRSEVAAIIDRMMNPSSRVNFTLG